MKKISTWIAVMSFFVLIFSLVWGQQNFRTLDNVKIEGNTVVITLSGSTKYHAFKISNPPKLVVEFSNTENNVKTKEITGDGKIINRVRAAQFQNEPTKIARVVVDLKKMVEYELASKGNEIVLTLDPKQKTDESAGISSESTEISQAEETEAKSDKETKTTVPDTAKKDIDTFSDDQDDEDYNDEELSDTKQSKAATDAKAESKQTVIPEKSEKDIKPAPKTAAKTAPKTKEIQPVKSAPVPETAPALKGADISSGKTKTSSVKTPIAQKKTVAAPAKKTAKSAELTKKSKPAEEVKAILPKKPVTLDFEEADIRDVLRILSMKSGINIIFGSDVFGTITLKLENVPFDKAFNTILSLKGLVSQEQGANILRIATPQQISTERSQAVAFTKIFPLNYAKGEDIKANLDTIRNAEGRRGNISVDTRTNSLIVTDTPEGLTSVERIIAELDKKPQQVIIEAKLVEITLKDNLDIGIQWSYARTIPTSNGVMTVGKTNILSTDQQGTGGTMVNGEIRTPQTPLSDGTGVTLPASAVAGQLGAISFGLVEGSSRLTAMLTALSEKGLSKILSNPKVTTINNKEARILVGQKIPYTTTTVAVSGTTQETQFLDVGIKLTVTPTINADRKITLQVNPSVSLFIRADAAGPVIGTREAQTTVLVNDGDTVVIGGLITEDDKKLVAQVPLLGDLPVIGHLFKHDFNSKERTELLVFITPQIIDN